MACEFLNNDLQAVSNNSPVIFEASIPYTKGYVYHEDGTGIFILRGIVNNSCNRFAHYQVTFNGNIALPTGGTVGPIAVAITVNGEEVATSKAISTPDAVSEFDNVTCTKIVKVPRGCCFSLSVDAVPGSTDPTATPAPVINVQNANLTIARIA